MAYTNCEFILNLKREYNAQRRGDEMKFYLLSNFLTDNCWRENEISVFTKDWDRKDDDPLHPKFSNECAPFCPVCHRSMRPSYPLSPLRREIHVARPYFGDIVVRGAKVYFSERAKLLYEESNLTGIEEFKKIEVLRVVCHNGVRKAKLPQVPTYYWCPIVVDGATWDYERSNAVYSDPDPIICEYCKDFTGTIRGYTGLYVDESRWNGSNIFELLGIGGKIMVDENFKSWVECNNLTGANLIPESMTSLDLKADSLESTIKKLYNGFTE